ncbi:Uncharacterised protein [Peptostreptococcus anaerobius]|uniref:Uncharacterized protein n=1 Tax=Peptostreptococcus anaerobius TaxID=1261 RepID=A0A379CEI3_9FIRM|nr:MULTISPECIES: hypothetical protein [Peptostreptococcus]MDU5350012.1 hypothetical protein [Peptostreptococcus sp.]MDU5891502.1 hypothetical protein [Peptostreptococcus sp.]SFM87326.1 hypothetical protein SAMN05660467_00661 [Peptostreptococcus anaerobius]SUB60176.1 Uncharacterised protein [Peptostreptococcus anaerobius]
MAKTSIKSSTTKGTLIYVGEELMFHETDKNGNVINEIPLKDFFNDYINQAGVTINIGYDREF